MSQTKFVEFRGEGFWAFDVVALVFLKHLIDAATQSSEFESNSWLVDVVEHWRVDAVVSDYGIFLDDSWSAAQLTTVSELVTAACRALSERDLIPAREIESWEMIEGHRCFARGLPFVSTAPATSLGRAITQLLNGTLPEPPPGTWWFFGTEEMAPTMGRRT